MIGGGELALLLVGLYVLVTGKLNFGKNRILRGTPARLLAVVALLPLPLSFVAAVLISGVVIATGHDPKASTVRWLLMGTEAGILVICVAVVAVIGRALASSDERTGPVPDKAPVPWAWIIGGLAAGTVLLLLAVAGALVMIVRQPAGKTHTPPRWTAPGSGRSTQPPASLSRPSTKSTRTTAQ